MRSLVVRFRRLLLAGGVITLVVAVHGGTQPLPGRPGIPTAGTPPSKTPDAATSVIRGTILAGNTGAPLRSATVTLLLRDAVIRVVSTDEEGRYAFDNVIAGRYLVMARRSGYLPWAYGQRDDDLPGQPLDVNAGMRLSAIDIRLPRNGAIVGRVTDEFGAPLSLVRVQAWRARTTGGRRRLDVSNLSPGLAFVSTRMDGRDVTHTGIWRDAGNRIEVEIALTSRVTEITGVARDGTGRAAHEYVVVCVSDDRIRQEDPLRRYQRFVRADQTGRYTVSGLPSGNYLIAAFDDLPAGALDEPRFVDRLRDLARPVTLTDGANKSIDLALRSY